MWKHFTLLLSNNNLCHQRIRWLRDEDNEEIDGTDCTDCTYQNSKTTGTAVSGPAVYDIMEWILRSFWDKAVLYQGLIFGLRLKFF